MITYDLHVHTCLSPGTDDNMTPVKVIDRAVENGLDIIAIADTNAIDNVYAAFEYAYDKDIAVIPAVEVISSEEVQLVCLFPDLQGAERMGNIIKMNMYDKKNKVKAFGHQYVMDEFDEMVREESRMLNFPTKMTVEEIIFSAKQFGGVAVYGQSENKANGVFSVLGSVPTWPRAKVLEFGNNQKGRAAADRAKITNSQLFVYSSNATTLNAINTKENSGDLEVFSEQLRDKHGEITASRFIDWLKSYEGV